jgi:SAM-dependent methyltransferase
MQQKPIYNSGKDKTEEVVQEYQKTHRAPHRYLAYRDIEKIIRNIAKGTKALDYGSGTGASTIFLHELGFDVVGIDSSANMIEQASKNYPFLKFLPSSFVNSGCTYDLIFSSFVLFEISSSEGIIEYLTNAQKCLNSDGIVVAITGAEQLYSPSRNWTTFNANYPENMQLRSGDMAKLCLNMANIIFYDYFWTFLDYLDFFDKAGLEILNVHRPLGYANEPYDWKDEILESPFVIFIARRKKTNID